MRGVRAVTIGGLALILAACSSADSPEQPKPSSPSQATTATGSTGVSCDDIGDGTIPPDSAFTIIDDAVALPSTGDPARQVTQPEPAAASTNGEVDPATDWYWAKIPLIIRSGHEITLSAAETTLVMGWGSGPTNPRSSVSANCTSDAEWLVIPGGFWVSQPGCYNVDVSVDGAAAQRVEIGIGAPCQGQQPPVAAN
ncbi:hypothetical protein EK0264_04250 [Epidermidibacterium keratini]|uniref:Uncharacterized protein n=1 Tax=Epidermidibacterium keratini TaxID=1891644 RepID=A0A7L4YL17_9ACTN|nr:hypothetical protein [Epidermidibacterium keratini]QHB99572.1 hypothetical protein EK0264_04250 [Epidermidibacterium keratini]